MDTICRAVFHLPREFTLTACTSKGRADHLQGRLPLAQRVHFDGLHKQGGADHLQGRLPLAQGVHFDGLHKGGGESGEPQHRADGGKLWYI